MGAIESLEHCCSDRSDEKTNKQYLGRWRAKTQRDLNRDYGDGPAICDEPLKDLKLDKSIDAEIAAVFKDVGHNFRSPICSQDQLSEILAGFRKRGYIFAGAAEEQQHEQLCVKVWAWHSGRRISILMFRNWFRGEAGGCRHNLCVLLSRSRYVADLVDRVYPESEHADDQIESVCEIMNNLRHHLKEKPISFSAIRKTARHIVERNGNDSGYVLSGRGKMLEKDFEALVMESLVQLYYEYFDYSSDSPSHTGLEDSPVAKAQPKSKVSKAQRRPASCLPTFLKSNALPVVDECRALERMSSAMSLKFPIAEVGLCH